MLAFRHPMCFRVGESSDWFIIKGSFNLYTNLLNNWISFLFELRLKNICYAVGRVVLAFHHVMCLGVW